MMLYSVSFVKCLTARASLRGKINTGLVHSKGPNNYSRYDLINDGIYHSGEGHAGWPADSHS